MYIVYKHTNLLNGKVYVGQTKYSPEKRWGRNGKYYLYHDTTFSRAINKYGWDNFSHKIIATGLTKIEADEMEISLIQKYKELKISYNMTIGGEGRVGIPFPEHLKKEVSKRFKGKPLTEEHKQRISNSLKGKSKSEVAKQHMRGKIAVNRRPVLQFSTDGEFIKEYSSIQEAAKQNNIIATHISRCARGKRKKTGGYIWKYKHTV